MVFGKFLLALFAVALPAFAASSPWTATFGEVGPLRIGMSLATVNEILGTRLALPAVPTQDPTNKCFYVTPPQVPAVQLMIVGNRLARIDVVRAGIATAQGVTVGAPGASVIATYGARATAAPAFYSPRHGQYITVLSADGKYGIRFVVVDGRVSTYYVGTAESVKYVEGCA